MSFGAAHDGLDLAGGDRGLMTRAQRGKGGGVRWGEGDGGGKLGGCGLERRGVDLWVVETRTCVGVKQWGVW